MPGFLPADDSAFAGRSMIVDAQGAVQAELNGETEGIALTKQQFRTFQTVSTSALGR